MSYVPLKKEIVFSDDVKNHPRYGTVMELIKALGDDTFKTWLLEHTASHSENAQVASSGNGEISPADNDLQTIGEILSNLVSRRTNVDEGVIFNCMSVFTPNPDLEAIALLRNVMGFLLSMQRFERMIIKIDNDIDAGKIPKQPAHLTRDGNAPSYLPRSMQTTKKYG